MDIILSLSWSSAYASVRGLILHFAPSWREAGLELMELDIAAQGWEKRLQEILGTRRIAFVLVTSGVGLRIEADGQNLWERLKLPVYSLLLDHPVYMAAAHRNQTPGTVLGYMFRDHALFQAGQVKSGNIVTSIDYGVPDLPMRPMAEMLEGRPRIVFAKTGNSPTALSATWRQAPKLEAVLYDVLDALGLEQSGNAYAGQFPALVAQVASAHRLEVQPFDLLCRFLIAQIDDYVRRRKSTAIATALLPFEVDVYGGAWSHIETSKAKARFHGPVDYATLEATLPSAIASITMNPNIALSAHDRFFTAIGAGSMPISDRNTYIDERFPEAAPYSFDFTPGSIESVLEKIVGNPAGTLEAARAMRARTRESDGVEHAAREILEAMKSAHYLHNVPKTAQNFFIA